MLAIMGRNRKIIEEDLMTLTYYMQGGLTLNDAYLLTTDQRTMMSKVIEKHYDAMGGKNKKEML